MTVLSVTYFFVFFFFFRSLLSLLVSSRHRSSHRVAPLFASLCLALPRALCHSFGHPGICTVTFCKGDAQAALADLRTKTLTMLQSNPWTAGRFLQKDLVFSNTCTETDVDDIITPNVLKNSAVNRNQPYPALVAAVAKNPNMSVQKGKHVQTTAGRIMKLVVVEPETSDGTFAIIFSMSHAAADGADYYRIFNMICGTDPVEVLNPVRVVEFETREPEWIGKKDHGWVGGGGGLIKGMLAGACCGPKANWCCYKVDSAKIGLAKTEAVAKAEKLGAIGVEYVSTNDILTSHFGRACAAHYYIRVYIPCVCDVCCMV